MFEIKNLTEEKVFIYILCYTYNLNLTHVMKLYELSDSVFKSYLKAFQPMTRLSNNRLITLRMQATRVYNIIQGNIPTKARETDIQLAQLMSRHLGRVYANANHFLTLEDLQDKNFSVVKEDDTREAISYNDFLKRYRSIKHIELNGVLYHRTTPINFLLCKYFGDRNSREILNTHLVDLYKMLEDATK